MNLLHRDIVPNLVAVIDLRHGGPVHAVAGQRQHYQPLRLAIPPPHATAAPTGPNPAATRAAEKRAAGSNAAQPVTAEMLLERYQNAGIGRFYVADLDGILDRSPQWPLLERLVAQRRNAEQLLLDIGWRGDEGTDVRRKVQAIAESDRHVAWVAAGESAIALNAPSALGELVGPANVWLGMDYRDGQWMALGADDETWVRRSIAANFGGAVLLDLASVGTGRGATTAGMVRRVRQWAPQWRLISGGGVRNASDVEQLLQAGCDGCLVATALHRRLIQSRSGQSAFRSD